MLYFICLLHMYPNIVSTLNQAENATLFIDHLLQLRNKLQDKPSTSTATGSLLAPHVGISTSTSSSLLCIPRPRALTVLYHNPQPSTPTAPRHVDIIGAVGLLVDLGHPNPFGFARGVLLGWRLRRCVDFSTYPHPRTSLLTHIHRLSWDIIDLIRAASDLP